LRNFSLNHLLKHWSYWTFRSWHSGLMLFIVPQLGQPYYLIYY
jgi:hypothetical protein